MLRWKNPQPSLLEADRYCYEAVATNRKERVREVIWKHNERGNGENGHKELKIGLGWSRGRAGSGRPMGCTLPWAC